MRFSEALALTPNDFDFAHQTQLQLRKSAHVTENQCFISSKEMHDDGYKFYLSKNGVWLTKEVPVIYLVKAEAVSSSTDLNT